VGVCAAVLLVPAAAACNRDRPDRPSDDVVVFDPTAGAEDTVFTGRYAPVDGLCATVDTSKVRAFGFPLDPPNNDPNRPRTDYRGTSQLYCGWTGEYEATPDESWHLTLTLSVGVQADAREVLPALESGRRSPMYCTGDRAPTTTEVPGLGDKAYQEVCVGTLVKAPEITYELHAAHDNALVNVKVFIFSVYASGMPYSVDNVAPAMRAVAESTLTSLRKQ
jgi:hypothetical protein